MSEIGIDSAGNGNSVRSKILRVRSTNRRSFSRGVNVSRSSSTGGIVDEVRGRSFSYSALGRRWAVAAAVGLSASTVSAAR